MKNDPDLTKEDVENTVASLFQAFIEALSGDVSARLFLKDQGIRFAINEDEAAHEVAAAKRWVREKGEPFRGFRRE